MEPLTARLNQVSVPSLSPVVPAQYVGCQDRSPPYPYHLRRLNPEIQAEASSGSALETTTLEASSYSSDATYSETIVDLGTISPTLSLVPSPKPSADPTAATVPVPAPTTTTDDGGGGGGSGGSDGGGGGGGDNMGAVAGGGAGGV